MIPRLSTSGTVHGLERIRARRDSRPLLQQSSRAGRTSRAKASARFCNLPAGIRTTIALTTALCLGLIFVPVAVGAAGGTVVICAGALGADGGTCVHYATHPATIESGADGRTVFMKLKWAHWGSSKTTAKGTLREDGGPASHPEYSYSHATMTANRVVSCDGRRAYTQLTIHAAGLPTMHFHGCGLE